MPKIYLIIHNVRSAHNVGSLLRTADGLGVDRVYMTGYTPYPLNRNDERLPHEAAKVSRQIQKTALGAETSVEWEYQADIEKLLKALGASGVRLLAIEQTAHARPIFELKPEKDTAIILGSEINGLDNDLVDLCDQVFEIPMSGAKESFNVAVAGAIALYQLRYGH